MTDYVLDAEGQPLKAGRRLERLPTAAVRPPADDWDLPAGLHVARQLVDELDALLEATVWRTGSDRHRAALLAGLDASLATGGREAVLPFDALGFDDHARAELAGQARSIGAALAGWAREANAARRGAALLGDAAIDALAVRSHCDGYSWTRPVVEILMGKAGGPLPMQLYNEWLHQFVLLRDCLLPFVNWPQVPLPLESRPGRRGLRALEPGREAFLGKLLTRRIPHAGIVRFAQAMYGGADFGGEAYGFQTPFGYALPAVFGRAPETAPRYLLAWHDARLVETEDRSPVSFVCEHEDYLAAPRSVIGAAGAHGDQATRDAMLAAGLSQGGTARVTLSFAMGGEAIAVDAGQIARGHRFAYFAGGTSERPEARPSADEAAHPAREVLKLPGLVAAPSGLHVIRAGDDPVAGLALLGKLLPGNVVLRRGGDWKAVAAAGKGHAAKFVLDMDRAA